MSRLCVRSLFIRINTRQLKWTQHQYKIHNTYDIYGHNINTQYKIKWTQHEYTMHWCMMTKMDTISQRIKQIFKIVNLILTLIN